MNITVLDDWQNTVRTLPSFQKVAGHNVTIWNDHTKDVAGWTKYQMMLLVGTSMLIQRFLMGFFWSSIF